jgi:LmbE family N-acetylglucosaminyl deacetylase
MNSQKNKMNILAVGCHPDDLEIGAATWLTGTWVMP